MRDRDVNVRVERGDAFRVSYVSGDPRTAQKVAERLGSLFIDENLRDREALAEQTSQFLEGQLEDARRRLLDHEKKLEAYRRLHAGELPTQLQGNLQAIQNAQMQLQSLTEGDESRPRAPPAARTPARRHRGGTIRLRFRHPLRRRLRTPRRVNGSSAEQLDAAIASRRTLLVRFKPDHPDVLALDRRIKGARAEGPGRAGQPGSRRMARPAACLTPRKSSSRTGCVISRPTCRRSTGISALKQDGERQLRAVIAGYQAKVDAAPTRESELDGTDPRLRDHPEHLHEPAGEARSLEAGCQRGTSADWRAVQDSRSCARAGTPVQPQPVAHHRHGGRARSWPRAGC